MQDVQNVDSWRQLAVGGAFRNEQDAARADASAVRDSMDKTSQIRRQLSLHRRHVTTSDQAVAAARRRRPNSSPGPARPSSTDAAAPPELPAALPPRDAWAAPDGEAGAAAAPGVRASSHRATRLHRALGSAKDLQGSAKGVQGGVSARTRGLCRSTHASVRLHQSPHGGRMPICGDMMQLRTVPHLTPPAECAVPRNPYAAESNLPRPRASLLRAAPSRAAPTHRTAPRTKSEGAANNKAVTAVAVEGEGEGKGEGGGGDSSGGEGEGVPPVSAPADVAVQLARCRSAPLRVSPSAPAFTGPRARSAGAAPAAHGTRGGPAAAWLATHQNYLPTPGSCESALTLHPPPTRHPPPARRSPPAAHPARRGQY